jgi:transcriptional regulator with XRE-family HTH domain
MAIDFRDLVGERIQLLRRRRGLTQPQLAMRCGMGIATLSRIEKGHQSVMGEKIVALAQELGTTSDYLLGLTDKIDKPERVTESEHNPAAAALV